MFYTPTLIERLGMGTTKLLYNNTKTEKENMDALLIDSGVDPRHVSELVYNTVTDTPEGETNSIVNITVDPGSILAATNGPWVVAYDRLPFVADNHPVITINAEEFGHAGYETFGRPEDGVYGHANYYNALKNKLYQTRGVHSGSFDARLTTEEIYKAFKEATQEQFDQGYIPVTIKALTTSKVLVDGTCKFSGPIFISNLKNKFTNRILGSTERPAWSFLKPKFRASYSAFWTDFVSVMDAAGAFNRGYNNKPQFDEASEFDISATLSLPDNAAVLSTGNGQAAFLNQVVENIGVRPSTYRLPYGGELNYYWYTEEFGSFFNYKDIQTGLIVTNGRGDFVTDTIFAPWSGYGSLNAISLRGGNLFNCYGSFLNGAEGEKCSIVFERDGSQKITKTTVVIKKTKLDVNAKGIEGCLIDALSEVIGIDYVSGDDYDNLKRVGGLTVDVNTITNQVTFSTAQASILFWGIEQVNYIVVDDSLDPDEPVIVPRSAGGFNEPEKLADAGGTGSGGLEGDGDLIIPDL